MNKEELLKEADKAKAEELSTGCYLCPLTLEGQNRIPAYLARPPACQVKALLLDTA